VPKEVVFQCRYQAGSFDPVPITISFPLSADAVFTCTHHMATVSTLLKRYKWDNLQITLRQMQSFSDGV